MTEVICITSQKGGVGKTTTAINLATALAIAEKKTLLIDCDPQGHATLGTGIDKAALSHTLYHGLLGQQPIEKLIIKSGINYLDIIPARIELLRAEVELKTKDHKERILSNLIEPCRSSYDFIIMDTAPALNLLTVNALVAADAILIPLQCEIFAVEGLLQWLQLIQTLKRRLHLQLRFCGILITMFVKNELLSSQIAARVQKNLPDLVFESMIHRDVHVREAALQGSSLLLQDITSAGARAYRKLAHEVIVRSLAQPDRQKVVDK